MTLLSASFVFYISEKEPYSHYISVSSTQFIILLFISNNQLLLRVEWKVIFFQVSFWRGGI